jgi:muconate cycloisomerase
VPVIESISTVLVDLPIIRPHLLAMTVVERRTLLIVRLMCSDAIEGLGEATSIGGLSYGDESPEGVKLCIDTFLAPALIGTDATNINRAMSLSGRIVQGNPFAKAAIETALLDAHGKRCGQSVTALLGGAVRDTLPVLWTLASGDTARDIDEAEELLAARRHQVFKLKVGRRAVAEDVAHALAIKRALGSRASVTVDVNQHWSEAEAAGAIAALEQGGIDLVEQPISKHNRAGMARLATRFVIPIMADEAVYGPEDAFDLARQAAADVFAVKVAKAGGIHAAQRTAAVADAAGVSLYGGTMLEGTIGTYAAAHLFRTLPQLQWGTELFGPLLLSDDVVTTKPQYHEFNLTLPSTPGLGIILDEEKLAFYRRDRQSFQFPGTPL